METQSCWPGSIVNYLDQRCPTVKRHSPQMWRQELLCRHICWQYFVAKIKKKKIFTMIYNGHNVSLYTYSKIDLLLHIWFTIFITAKNVKFKKLSFSPHLNCLSNTADLDRYDLISWRVTCGPRGACLRSLNENMLGNTGLGWILISLSRLSILNGSKRNFKKRKNYLSIF